MTIDVRARKAAIFGLGGLVLILAVLWWGRPSMVKATATPTQTAFQVAHHDGHRSQARMAVSAPTGAKDDLAQALLGESDTPLTPEARRLLGQALLSLDTMHATVHRMYGEAEDHDVVVLRAYGRVLFLNDYNYAARACPELDPGRAEVAYTNALQALQKREVMALAKEALTTGVGHARLPASMEDQYAKAFSAGMPSGAYSNVLEVLGRFDANPLSTDLFNDAVIFVMSTTELEEMQAQVLHGFSQVARSGRAGKAPAVAELENVNTDDLDLAGVDDNVHYQFSTPMTVYREVFAYRFAQNHGLDGERLVGELAKLAVPPTALWIHIEPPAR